MNPLLLLCGKININSSAALPCRCHTADQLIFASSKVAVIASPNKTMCSIYNPKNLITSIRLVIPRGEPMRIRFETWEPLLLLSRFYSQDNLVDLISQLFNNNSTNVTATTPEGENALMVLLKHSKNNQIERIVKLLLTKGIDVNQIEPFYQNNALLVLSEYYSDGNKLAEIFKLLVDKDVDVNHTNRIKHNALMNVCKYSNSDQIDEVVKLLLANGIDVNQNLGGSHALSILCEYSKSPKIRQVAELLIASGIKLNMKDGHGNNALMNLCEFSKSDKIVEVAELLIKNGIDFRSKDSEGDNALMLLCRFSRSEKIVEMAELLIANGIDLNEVNDNGDNALMLLCSGSKSEKIIEVTQLLIANGINVKQRNNRGKDAIDLLKGPMSIFATLFAADDTIRPKKPQIFQLIIEAH